MYMYIVHPSLAYKHKYSWDFALKTPRVYTHEYLYMYMYSIYTFVHVHVLYMCMVMHIYTFCNCYYIYMYTKLMCHAHLHRFLAGRESVLAGQNGTRRDLHVRIPRPRSRISFPRQGT